MKPTQDITGLKKPRTVRAIFIMNALKILLALGFYLVFRFTDVSIDGLDPSIILYTFFAYVVLFAAMVASILKRNMMGLRISIVLDFLASIPAKGIIGFIIAIASMALTFRKTAQAYFQYSAD